MKNASRFLIYWKGFSSVNFPNFMYTKISLKDILGEYSATVETAETAESVDQLFSSYSSPPSSI